MVQWELCSMNFHENIVNLRVLCYNGNNDWAARSLCPNYFHYSPCNMFQTVPVCIIHGIFDCPFCAMQTLPRLTTNVPQFPNQHGWSLTLLPQILVGWPSKDIKTAIQASWLRHTHITVVHRGQLKNCANSFTRFGVLFWLGTGWFYPYSSVVLHWHWGNHMTALVPVKQPLRIWENYPLNIRGWSDKPIETKE